jgi:OPA family glycerol-3-phosphate transporter-like MFS transporter
VTTTPPALSPALKTWRWRIFASTWLCYAGFYFCRKPFYIAKSSLGDALHFDATALGVIGAVYLVAYTIGQFVAGAAAWRSRPRPTWASASPTPTRSFWC